MAQALALNLPAFNFPGPDAPEFSELDGMLGDVACSANDPGPSPARLVFVAEASDERNGLHPMIVATGKDGTEYDGDLIADVIEYRELRVRDLRGELQPGDGSRLVRLESRVRASGQVEGLAALRTYHRFGCDFTGELVAPATEDREHDESIVRVRDISAGGLKIESNAGVLEPGDVVFISLPRPGTTQTITFPARVAWMKSDAFGLMFAGAARCAPGEGAR